MAEIYANNASGSLAEAITSGDTKIPLSAGHSMPDPDGDWYRVTMYRWEFTSKGIHEFDHEVMKVTKLAGDTLTVERGIEGTTANAYDPDTSVEMRLTAKSMAKAEKTRKNVRLMQLGIDLL